MKKVIVVPTYNERKNIGDLVPLIFKIIPDANVLVVDDNSPDETALAVEEMQKTYPSLSILKRQKKEGLGRAYTNAFREVLKDQSVGAVVMMDADGSHNPEYLSVMLQNIDKADVVIGSRYVPGGRTAGWELWRRLLSRGGNLYCRTITGIPIKDCTGGFNIIRADLLRKIDLSKLDSSGYAFMMELKFALYKSGAKFLEVPILFINRREGESKMSGHIIREGIIAPWKIRLKK